MRAEGSLIFSARYPGIEAFLSNAPAEAPAQDGSALVQKLECRKLLPIPGREEDRRLFLPQALLEAFSAKKP